MCASENLWAFLCAPVQIQTSLSGSRLCSGEIPRLFSQKRLDNRLALLAPADSDRFLCWLEIRRLHSPIHFYSYSPCFHLFIKTNTSQDTVSAAWTQNKHSEPPMQMWKQIYYRGWNEDETFTINVYSVIYTQNITSEKEESERSGEGFRLINTAFCSDNWDNVLFLVFTQFLKSFNEDG